MSTDAPSIKLLVPNHDLDFVTRRVLDRVSQCPDIRVIIAGPDEAGRDTADGPACGHIEAVKIRSKLDFKAIRDYRRIIHEHDINTTFSPSTSGLATMLSASIGLKVRNIGYRGTQARVRRTDPTNYLALLNPRVSHVVCETADIIRSLGSTIGRDKVSGMPKPYELSWVDEAMAHPRHIPIPDGCDAKEWKSVLHLIYIGMTKGRPHKGLRQLVDAMRLTGNRSVHLTVIGSYDEDVRACAPDNVTFIGPQPGAVAYIPECDVLMLPSLRDASPRTVREAQACGVPCIVTDIPGARDLIENGKTGLLVEPNSPQSIADAINRMHDNPAVRRRMAEACRPHIRDNYALEPYAEYFINMLRGRS